MWDDSVIGKIDESYSVQFVQPNFNEVVKMYTHGRTTWTADEFGEFLTGRVVSRDRRDIEKILFRCGLSYYDPIKIAKFTRGVHPNDLLWISESENEKLNDIISDVFESVFYQKFDAIGDSIDTPEGYNIKRYGVFNEQYGIYKQRISPLMTDVESEIAVYLLAKRLGVACCPAHRVDDKTMFSTFLYDFREEYIVHFRRLFDGARSDNEYQNLVNVRPQYRDSIVQMIVLDFITRQDDRHLSNLAIKVSGSEESFYPLYDNGRSLFYEDTEELVELALIDVGLYSTTFGYAGTYWDFIQEITAEGTKISDIVDLSITQDEITDILTTAGFKGYRYMGALAWITKTIEKIKEL